MAKPPEVDDFEFRQILLAFEQIVSGSTEAERNYRPVKRRSQLDKSPTSPTLEARGIIEDGDSSSSKRKLQISKSQTSAFERGDRGEAAEESAEAVEEQQRKPKNKKFNPMSGSGCTQLFDEPMSDQEESSEEDVVPYAQNDSFRLVSTRFYVLFQYFVSIFN